MELRRPGLVAMTQVCDRAQLVRVGEGLDAELLEQLEDQRADLVVGT